MPDTGGHTSLWIWLGSLARSTRPTVWVIEGLTMYLDSDACDALLGRVREVAVLGDYVLVDYYSRAPSAADFDDEPQLGARRVLAGASRMAKSGPGAAPTAWLQSHGLSLTGLSTTANELHRAGRELPPMMDPRKHANPFVEWLVAGRVER